MSDSSRASLPFEPNKKSKRKAAKDSPANSSAASQAKSPKASKASKSSAPSRKRLTAKNIDMKPTRKRPSSVPSSRSASADGRDKIPDEVNRRMLARMGAFSGTPSILGILVLIGSYITITRDWFPLPSVAVLLVSMGCFGLGVVGLTYGALSASWDVGDEGSPLGWQEFQTNVGRLRQGWREARAEEKRRKESNG